MKSRYILLFVCLISIVSTFRSYADENSTIPEIGERPSQPVLIEAHAEGDLIFNYEFNYYESEYFDQTSFHFEFLSDNAERYLVETTDYFYENENSFRTTWYKKSDEDGHLRDSYPYFAWGQYFRIYGVNKYGYSQPTVICTTDFITDPDVLARIKELHPDKFVSTSVEDILSQKEDDKIYDIMGHEVQTPLPNRIYIKNGKKFILK